MCRYKKGGAQNAQLLMPHVYHLVDSTYAQMMTEQKSQSILISGESGAGKTEAMKICLAYVAFVADATAAVRLEDPQAVVRLAAPVLAHPLLAPFLTD